jgi:hypothetical protein
MIPIVAPVVVATVREAVATKLMEATVEGRCVQCGGQDPFY